MEVRSKDLAPMRALRLLRRDFPNALQEMDKVCGHKAHIEGWDQSRCYCPVGLALSYFTDYFGVPRDFDSIRERLAIASDAKALAVLSSWRQTKFVYDVDDALARELLSMDKAELDVNSDMLSIPAFCVYIRTGVFDDTEGFSPDGFYVMFDCDITRHHLELYIVPSGADGSMGAPIWLVLPPKAEKLSAVLAQESEDTVREGFRDRLPLVIKGGQMLAEMFEPVVRFIVNVLLYLSAVNADVRPARGNVQRKSAPAREVSAFSVGESVGVRIRTLQRAVLERRTPQGGHHRTPAMHIRRAHYHTFLVGKGRKERRIKWLAPVLVNADGGEVPVTVTKVKK